MAVRLAPPPRPAPPSPPPQFQVPSPPPPAPPVVVAPHSLTSTCICLGIYFTFNLTLTLYNKLIFSAFAFPFPWTLTAIHTLCGTLGCYLCAATGLFVPARLGRREKYVMAAFSVLYTVNIAISNVSLNLVTVPFHQVVRSTVPLFTIFLSTLCLSKHYSHAIYLSLLPIVFGVVLATTADYNYTLLGLLLTLLGTMLAAVKTIVTNIVQVGELRLHPLDLLLRMSPLACVQTVLWAVATGEAREVVAWLMMATMSGHNDNAGNAMAAAAPNGGGGMASSGRHHPAGGNHAGWVTALALLVNGALAFGLNVASFVANRRTSALTMCVAGNVKQVLSIILSVAIFQLHITTTNAGGILITLLGGIYYTYVDYREKNSVTASTSSSSSSPSSAQSLLPTTKQHLPTIRSSKHAHDDDDDDDDDNDESGLDRDSSTTRLLDEGIVTSSGGVSGEMVEVVIRSPRGGAPTA
ncbi:UAA transporter [Geranomyces variabilis]|uniref:UAA transporter n=1 Tax=Geranomyces variabilis TaxID=109894 RepID=A0AAD5TFI9_9FUNG|nr:UAA transporter [Geranomyces variabilis]